MSTRRPRIKPVANIPIKREGVKSSPVNKKPNESNLINEKDCKTSIKDVPTTLVDVPLAKVKIEPVPVTKLERDIEVDSSPVASEFLPESNENLLNEVNLNHPKLLSPRQDDSEIISPSSPLKAKPIFKCPPLMSSQKRIESSSPMEVDDNSEILNANKTFTGPPSPIKHRQRIRPMPCIGFRRNSGYSSDVDEEPRRQRYLSSSSTHTILPSENSSNLNKPNRIRTESSCSNVSAFTATKENRLRKNPAGEEFQKIAAAKREFLHRFNGKRPEKSSLKMFDLIYYNPVTNPMSSSLPKNDDDKDIKPKIISTDNVKSPPDKKVKDFTKKDDAVVPVPQLKLGPNGELVLDEKSLVIETTGDREARAELANSKVVYLDEYSGNNGFYKRTKRTRDWPPKETIKFYKCLHTIGTDFSLMLSLFPNRSRRDLKLKFKKEEKNNLSLVNKALLYPKTFNIEDLQEELKKEEMEAEEKRKKFEEVKKAYAEQKANKPKARQYNTSKCGRILSDGDYVYKNENIEPPSKLKKKAKPRKKPIKKSTPKKSNNTEATRKISESNDPIQEEEYYLDNDVLPADELNAWEESILTETLQNCDELLGLENENNITDDITTTTTTTTAIETTNTATEKAHHDDIISDCEISKFNITNLSIESTDMLPTDHLEQIFDNSISNQESEICANVVKSELKNDTWNGDINQILDELANGSLVVVSSESPDDPSKVTNELYAMCLETGHLSENPLDVPEEILNLLLSEAFS